MVGPPIFFSSEASPHSSARATFRPRITPRSCLLTRTLRSVDDLTGRVGIRGRCGQKELRSAPFEAEAPLSLGARVRPGEGQLAQFAAWAYTAGSQPRATPQYNGSCEAAGGSRKKITDDQAALAAHPGRWTERGQFDADVGPILMPMSTWRSQPLIVVVVLAPRVRIARLGRPRGR
jgi:hypothetical protein